MMFVAGANDYFSSLINVAVMVRSSDEWTLVISSGSVVNPLVRQAGS